MDSKNTSKDQHQDDGQSLTLNKKNKDLYFFTVIFNKLKHSSSPLF